MRPNEAHCYTKIDIISRQHIVISSYLSMFYIQQSFKQKLS